MDQAAYNWLIAANPNRWARSHFSCRAKCDAITNNLCESFNSYILEVREKPIVGLLECEEEAYDQNSSEVERNDQI